MIYRLVKPLLFRMEPERAHEFVTAVFRLAIDLRLPAGLIQALYSYTDPILATECAGLHCANPVGLAAGFDKRATLIEPMALLGFGHIEVGTVTPRPQPGNPRPRMFRLPEDAALVNRLGFNSPGMLPVAAQLRKKRREIGVIVGANIGKNRDTALEHAVQDYMAAFVALAPLADYMAINISSPNTPGLRKLHDRTALTELVGTLADANRQLAQPRPLFLKISPDESDEQIEEVVEVGSAAGIAGFIATNTTLDRSGLHSHYARETGGLSGKPLNTRAHKTLARLYILTGGRMPLIGVGGISSAADAYARIRAGANMVQLYTGLIYAGPAIVHDIKRGLADLLRRDGFLSISEAVGKG